MHPKKKTAILIFVAIVIVALIVLFLVSSSSSPSQNAENSAAAVVATSTSFATTTATTTSTQVTASTVPPADAPKYKNGTYTAVGKYNSPAGPETINVSLTLTNDIVTDATVVSLAPDAHSQRYQGYFISGYKQYVVGKNIDSINLVGDISGSSLTPKGFDDALTTIKSEALVS